MIILKFNAKFNPISQKVYNNHIRSINLYNIECPHCCGHNWSYHSCYKRSVDFFGYMTKILITRVICNDCHHTHAILIEGMIPYSSLSYEDIVFLLELETQDPNYYYIYSKYKNINKNYSTFCLLNKRNFFCIFT